jgi:hypothetical protein
VLFQRQVYLSLYPLSSLCSGICAVRKVESIEGYAQLPDPVEGAESQALHRFETRLFRRRHGTELEARVQRLEAELSQLRTPTYSDPLRTLEWQLRRQEAGSGALFGAIEVTFLQPHISGSQAAFGLGCRRATY